MQEKIDRTIILIMHTFFAQDVAQSAGITLNKMEVISSNFPPSSCADMSKKNYAHIPDLVSRWKKPMFGRYKVNWDVTIDFHCKCLGYGVIVRDHSDFILLLPSARG